MVLSKSASTVRLAVSVYPFSAETMHALAIGTPALRQRSMMARSTTRASVRRNTQRQRLPFTSANRHPRRRWDCSRVDVVPAIPTLSAQRRSDCIRYTVVGSLARRARLQSGHRVSVSSLRSIFVGKNQPSASAIARRASPAALTAAASSLSLCTRILTSASRNSRPQAPQPCSHATKYRAMKPIVRRSHDRNPSSPSAAWSVPVSVDTGSSRDLQLRRLRLLQRSSQVTTADPAVVVGLCCCLPAKAGGWS